MKSIEVSIQISIKASEVSVDSDKAPVKVDDGQFRLVLNKGDLFDIDGLENGLLQATYPAMRDSLKHALEDATKERVDAECQRRGESYRIVRHKSDYHVDGEVGRFQFGLFDVVGPDGERAFAGSKLWPMRKGKEWYQTAGFKELALMMGAVQRSYRKTTNYFNRSRRQEVGGTALNTLRDGAERQGAKVIQFLERKSDEVLRASHFQEDGTFEEGCPVVKEMEGIHAAHLLEKEVKDAMETVGQAMRRRGFSEELIGEVSQKSRVADYEQGENTVNIFMDDVGVKEQKEERVKDVADAEKAQDNGEANIEDQQSEGNKRPTVQNTVAHIEKQDHRFTLTGSSVLQVLRFVLAFLLNNSLIGQQLLFFTDGQRSLQGAIIAFFCWHPAVSLILDWFHLTKKFKEELSLACRGRKIRNQHLLSLLRLLWVGLIDRAQDYLRSIPAADLKNKSATERLITYLERNRQRIPCYALRRQLGLSTSSNPVERTNNLVTSSRQKHNGMSWSKAGSHALTALSAVVLNGDTKTWVHDGVIPFKLAKAA
jgi:hypothetical protein